MLAMPVLGWWNVVFFLILKEIILIEGEDQNPVGLFKDLDL